MNSANPVDLLVLSSALVFLPFIVGAASAYVKISIVMSTLRTALGQQQIPGPLVSSALSCSLSLLVMWPVLIEMHEQIEVSETVSTSMSHRIRPVLKPWKEFLQKHTDPEILKRLQHRSKERTCCRNDPDSAMGIQSAYLLAGFLLSEMESAFEIAVVILLPFLLIDLLVSLILAGLGMFMVSPVMISFPLKLLLLVYSGFLTRISDALLVSYGV